VGDVGHRLFEFRGGLRGVQAARASFDGRPPGVRYGRKSLAEQRKEAEGRDGWVPSSLVTF